MPMFCVNTSILGCFEITSTLLDEPPSPTAYPDLILSATIGFNSAGNGSVPATLRRAISLKSMNCHPFGSSTLSQMNGLCSALEFGMNAPSPTATVNLASIDHENPIGNLSNSARAALTMS